MTQKEEIQDLKEQVNNLILEVTRLAVKSSVLESAFLGVMHDVHPEHYSNLYTNFVNALEKEYRKATNKTADLLYETDDSAFLTRQKQDIFMEIQSMKRDKAYML